MFLFIFIVTYFFVFWELIERKYWVQDLKAKERKKAWQGPMENETGNEVSLQGLWQSFWG